MGNGLDFKFYLDLIGDETKILVIISIDKGVNQIFLKEDRGLLLKSSEIEFQISTPK